MPWFLLVLTKPFLRTTKNNFCLILKPLVTDYGSLWKFSKKKKKKIGRASIFQNETQWLLQLAGTYAWENYQQTLHYKQIHKTKKSPSQQRRQAKTKL